MRKIYISDWEENGDYYQEEENLEAFLLDPNERVVNVDRARELVHSIENDSFTFEEDWKHLKKELGL